MPMAAASDAMVVSHPAHPCTGCERICAPAVTMNCAHPKILAYQCVCTFAPYPLPPRRNGRVADGIGPSILLASAVLSFLSKYRCAI